MGFGVDISEAAAAELAVMDEVTAELLLMEILGLADAPFQGVELQRDGAVSWRMLGVGALGLVMFETDESAKMVRVLDVVWTRPD